METEHQDHQVSVYNRMMERVRHALETAEHRAYPNLEHAIERARERAVELGEMTREEAERVADFIRRDLRNLSRYVNDTGKEYSDWFHMDVALIEANLLDLFASVADNTTLELAQWAAQAARPRAITAAKSQRRERWSAWSARSSLGLRRQGEFPCVRIVRLRHSDAYPGKSNYHD